MRYTILLYFLQIHPVSYLPFELWMDLQIADWWNLKYFGCRFHPENGFLFREYLSLYHTGVKENVLSFPNPTIIPFSLQSPKGTTRKTAVLGDRYSEALYWTQRYFYNFLLFRSNGIRKNTCHSHYLTAEHQQKK